MVDLWVKSSWCLNNVCSPHETHPAFLGKSQASLCGFKSWNLSFPVIVYDIFFLPGCKSRAIQQLLPPNFLTLLLGNSFTQCENHSLCSSQPFFSCYETIFQPALSQSITQNARKTDDQYPSKYEGNCVAHHILLLWFKALSRISKLTRWACSVQGGARRGARRGVGSAVASWLHSVVTHNGATSRPQRASTSRALPLFKNVFVLLFFLGTV